MVLKMISFYKVDQAPHTGWKYIGVEGKEIEYLTDNGLCGSIFKYSYIKGSDEFYFDHDNCPEFGKMQGRWMVLIRGDTALIRHNDKLVDEHKWQETRQYYTRKDSYRTKLFGKESGRYYSKNVTPRNCIRIIVKTMVKIKKGD